MTGTLELIGKMEQALTEDMSSLKVKNRRRSMGNVSIVQLMNQSVVGDSPKDKRHSVQMKKAMNAIDQTMNTEAEYLKLLHETSHVERTDAMNESSFFKGTFINVEKSADNKEMQEENLALREVNEQNLKVI